MDVVIPPGQQGQSNPLDLYLDRSEAWEEELRKLLDFWCVKVCYLARKEFPRVTQALKEARLLVYSRNPT